MNDHPAEGQPDPPLSGGRNIPPLNLTAGVKFETRDHETRDAEPELKALREREREIMELLGAPSPDRILHDLRNLINEVNLLRVLMDTEEQ